MVTIMLHVVAELFGRILSVEQLLHFVVEAHLPRPSRLAPWAVAWTPHSGDQSLVLVHPQLCGER